MPVAGAVLLSPNQNEVIMVRGLKDTDPFGFPKGKVEEGEENDLAKAAKREILEETGLKVELDSMTDSFERSVKGKRFTLFITLLPYKPNTFKPTVNGEIGEVKWMKIEAMRPGADSSVSQVQAAFYSSIKEWIAASKASISPKRGSSNQHRHHRQQMIGARRWCLHETCLESVQSFGSDKALAKHMTRCHGFRGPAVPSAIACAPRP